MVRTGDYSLGKIYKLVSKQTDKIYIGSTCQRLLSSRLVGHRNDYKKWVGGNYDYHVRSFDIMAFGDAQIILIENFPCKDKYELEARERYYIESMACVNKVIPTRGKQEYDKDYREKNKEKIAESKKQWVEKNREHVRNQLKEWRENNQEYKIEYDKKYYQSKRDELLVKCKTYRDAHKENAQEYHKMYRERQREQLKEYYEQYKNQRVTCDICGICVSKAIITRHKKTPRCQSFIKKPADESI